MAGAKHLTASGDLTEVSRMKLPIWLQQQPARPLLSLVPHQLELRLIWIRWHREMTCSCHRSQRSLSVVFSRLSLVGLPLGHRILQASMGRTCRVQNWRRISLTQKFTCRVRATNLPSKIFHLSHTMRIFPAMGM